MELKVSGFQLLPNDLILKIFTYVSIRDLGNCAQLSKNLRLIANDKELWIKFLFTRGQIPDGFVEYVLSKGKVIHPKYYKNSIKSYNLISIYDPQGNFHWHNKYKNEHRVGKGQDKENINLRSILNFPYR